MNESVIYKTLSSPSRVQILRLLYRKPLSVEEMAGQLDLQPITVRHHLQGLMEAGLIEYQEEHSGTVGRPKAYYRIVKIPPTASFPRRQYQLLSEALVDSVLKNLGNKAKPVLKEIGIKMGEQTIRKIEAEHNVKSWTPKEYEEYFIKQYLEKEGTEPEIIESTDRRIAYRLHNCLFFELATKMPEIMCDVLHESFYEGVAKATGTQIRTERSTCMGKGALYCEHVCMWPSTKK